MNGVAVQPVVAQPNLTQVQAQNEVKRDFENFKLIFDRFVSPRRDIFCLQIFYTHFELLINILCFRLNSRI
jgi:hypothetical protein